MTVNVLVPIADGSEEMEAITLIDVLRRAGMAVCVASVMPQKTIKASRLVTIVADKLISECLDVSWDLIVIPGGMPGAENLGACAALISLIQRHFDEGKWLAAICASPAVVLGRNGLIHKHTATCYPGFQPELISQINEVKQSPVVVDKNLVTSQGPGTAIAFSLTLVELLIGLDKAEEVGKGLLVSHSVVKESEAVTSPLKSTKSL